MSRQRININREWRFLREDVPNGADPVLDDSAWQRVNLPHTFDLPYFRTPEFYVGYGWYRRAIDLEATSDRRYFLEFDGVLVVTDEDIEVMLENG